MTPALLVISFLRISIVKKIAMFWPIIPGHKICLLRFQDIREEVSFHSFSASCPIKTVVSKVSKKTKIQRIMEAETILEIIDFAHLFIPVRK